MILFSRNVAAHLDSASCPCLSSISIIIIKQSLLHHSVNASLLIYLASACDYANIPWIWGEDLWDGWCDGTNTGDCHYISPSISYVHYITHTLQHHLRRAAKMPSNVTGKCSWILQQIGFVIMNYSLKCAMHKDLSQQTNCISTAAASATSHSTIVVLAQVCWPLTIFIQQVFRA